MGSSSNRRTHAPQACNQGATPCDSTVGTWGVSSKGFRRLSCKQEIGVQLPAVPLTGLWSNGKTSPRQGGNPGSTPGRSTDYGREPNNGSSGRTANADRLLQAVWVQLPPLPLTDRCPGGETESCHASNVVFQVQILAGVLWSGERSALSSEPENACFDWLIAHC